MELAGWPAGRPGTGELVRIWFSVGLGCSDRLKGLVGDGVLRPGKEQMGHVRAARPPPALLLLLFVPCPPPPQPLASSTYPRERGCGSWRPE